MISHTSRKVFAMNCFSRFQVPIVVPLLCLAVVTGVWSGQAQGEEAESRVSRQRSGRHLFERETFGGNGRTCLTCHSRETGTVSPKDARARFAVDPHDPLFLHDGSDD